MKIYELLSFDSSARGRRSTAAVTGIVSFGLSGLIMVGGCNKAPAPAAEPAPAAQAAPAPAVTEPAPAPPAAAGPAPTTAMTAAPNAAMTAAPNTAMKAAPAPPPAPREYTVPAGTPIVVRVAQTISAKDSNVGDTFAGTLAQSVLVGKVKVIPAGAPATGTVTASKGQGRFKGSGALGISIRRVGEYSVTTSSYEASAKGKGKRSAEFIGGGGGGGALIGGLAGGGKGALLGGLLGAGAGTAGAVFTGNKNITIPAESVVTFTLTAPVTVTGR
jgi:hypothetical protein